MKGSDNSSSIKTIFEAKTSGTYKLHSCIQLPKEAKREQLPSSFFSFKKKKKKNSKQGTLTESQFKDSIRIFSNRLKPSIKQLIECTNEAVSFLPSIGLWEILSISARGINKEKVETQD